MSHKWGHDELAADLANHLRGKGDIMAWENMQIGPSGSPRPDVYTIGKTFVRFCPMTYEIKVSVSDFRSDVTSGKWQSYLKFSGAVIFATPVGLISKADVPAGCGLIQRSETGWRVAKAPTIQRVDSMHQDVWLKLLMTGVERAAEQQKATARRVAHDWTVKEHLNKRFGQEVGELVYKVRHNKMLINSDIEALEKQRATIKDLTHWELKSAKENIERSEARFSAAQAELASALGLEVDANTHTLITSMRKAANRLNENSEIQRLTNAFKQIEICIEQGLLPLPVKVEA